MPKLVASRMVRLYGVSKKPGKREEYKLMQFDNDAFNSVFDEAEIGDILMDLVNDIYGHEEGNHWFLIADCRRSCRESNNASTFPKRSGLVLNAGHPSSVSARSGAKRFTSNRWNCSWSLRFS